MQKLEFKEEHYDKVKNYLKNNFYSYSDIKTLIDYLSAQGEVVLVGEAVKDIAFFNTYPTNFDIVVVTPDIVKFPSKILRSYPNKENHSGGYVVKIGDIVIDVWSTDTLDLDGLYIYLNGPKKYSAKVWNNFIKTGEIAISKESLKKELHIWMRTSFPGVPKDINTTFLETRCALKTLNSSLNKGEDHIVHTTQPHFCSTKWLTKGYRIFVHMADGEVVEIKLGYMNEHYKEIRVAHNLEKLLLANVFGDATGI